MKTKYINSIKKNMKKFFFRKNMFFKLGAIKLPFPKYKKLFQSLESFLLKYEKFF